jgi:hypothetical protein
MMIGLLALLGVIAYVIASALIHEVGFPLDDAWIHQTYARNLGQNGEWAFEPGKTSVASTSPFYTVLLGLGYALRLPYFAWSFTLGAVALAGAGWIARRLGAQMFPGAPGAGVWSALSIVTAWHLVWAAVAGMETMLFSALSLGVVALAWREMAFRSGEMRRAFGRGVGLGLLGAMLTLTRPEGVGLIGLVVLVALLAWRASLWRYVAWGSGTALAWSVGVLPYVALNYDVSGSLLPNTSAAKQAEYRYLLDQWSVPERYGQLLFPLVIGGLLMLLPGVITGVYDIARRAGSDRRAIMFALPILWALLDVSVYALRLPANYQHGRYVLPVLPHLMLYGVGGTLIILRASQPRPVGRVLSRVLAISAVFVAIGFWGIGARQYGYDVRIINTEMVDTAKWIEQNIPPEELLAVHDIGAVGYFAPRPIFDLAGLVSPEVVPVIHDDVALMNMMQERSVVYLMALPDQIPAPATDPRLGGEPVFTTGAPYAVAAGGGNMAVYRMNWREGCP